jgi:DinB family protein
MAHTHPTRFEPVREKLERVRLRFLSLLDKIPEKDWDRHLPGEGWTIKQEMVHMVQVLNVLPNGIRRASKGGERSILAIVPTHLRSWFNGHIIVPFMARSATRQSTGEAYSKAHGTLVKILEVLPEEAWGKGMPYPKKYRTVEQMALRPIEHFEEHLVHLQNVLGSKIEDS